MTIDRGLCCLACGIIHQKLINHSNLQLLLLGCVELMWIMIKIIAIKQNVYRHKALAYINLIENLIRICFQLNCYLYANHIEMKLTINETIFPYIIFGFIITWLAQIIMSIFIIFNEIIGISR